jgi:NADPH:quinone reductase-like Zn-dependent oxidoreductase
MRRVRQHEHGGPETLRVEEAPVPEPGAGEVLIEVESVGVTLPVLSQLRGSELPWCPGGDIAGRVVASGAGVAGFRVGERVAGLTLRDAYAEFAAVPAVLLSRVPEGIGAAEAMTVARGGLVAMGALHAAKLADGESVLVTAAAGGVGHMAVQLARALGAARVVAAVGSPEKLAFVQKLGADEAVSYQDGDWGAPVDVVVDAVGGDVLRRGVDALAPFGRLVSYSAAGGRLEVNTLRDLRTVTGFAMGRIAAANRDLVEEMRRRLWELLADGRLSPIVHCELDLADAPRACEIIAARANLGKVALRAA